MENYHHEVFAHIEMIGKVRRNISLREILQYDKIDHQNLGSALLEADLCQVVRDSRCKCARDRLKFH